MGWLLLIAASGLAREVITVVDSLPDVNILGIVDDDPSLHGTSVHNVPIVGPLEAVTAYPEAQLLICAGHGRVRREIVARLAALSVADTRYTTVIDQSVRVPSSCSVGFGSILLAHSVLTADIRIGKHVVVMPNVTLTHDDVIEDFGTVCAGVSLGGDVTIGSAAYIGINASVRERTAIGADALVGMGAVVLGDVPRKTTVAGNPARPLSSSHPPAASERSRDQSSPRAAER